MNWHKTVDSSTNGAADRSHVGAETGFTLVEILIAILILTFGLLAAGQLLMMAMGSASLSRAKGSATLTAYSRLELLADLYRQNKSDANLTNGTHGPVVVELLNPSNNHVLNRYNVSWTVSTVPDPRAGKVIAARQVTVTVSPINSAGNANNRTGQNKVVSVSSILSPRIQ